MFMNMCRDWKRKKSKIRNKRGGGRDEKEQEEGSRKEKTCAESALPGYALFSVKRASAPLYSHWRAATRRRRPGLRVGYKYRILMAVSRLRSPLLRSCGVGPRRPDCAKACRQTGVTRPVRPDWLGLGDLNCCNASQHQLAIVPWRLSTIELN
jgi:hypothetical protein